MRRSFELYLWWSVVLLVASAHSAHAQTTASWVKPDSGNWTDATNWSTNPFYPSNGNPSGTTYNVVFNNPSGSFSVNPNGTPNNVTVNDFPAQRQCVDQA